MSKNYTKIGELTVCDTSFIYSRVLCLQKVQNIEMFDVYTYEFAAIPPSLFDEKTGTMCQSAKSILKLEHTLVHYHQAPAGCIILEWIDVLCHGQLAGHLKEKSRITLNHF